MDNHVLGVMGRATANALQLETKAGKDFTKFTVAVNDYRGPDKERLSAFYEVVCFSRQPRSVAKAVQKGDTVMVIGKPEIQAYQAKTGEPKAKIGINANYITLFGIPKHLRTEVIAEADEEAVSEAVADS